MLPQEILWSIGSPDGRSEDLVDTYKEPTRLDGAVWRVAGTSAEPQKQQWPLFHPSEADPDAGYRLHPYTIEFSLDSAPAVPHLLRIHSLVITPRLPHLEVQVNGVSGCAYLRPTPSQSGEIRVHAGLHTTIYSEGVAEIIIPPALLQQGENRLTLICRDAGEMILVERTEAIKRLDRMASSAGLLYQWITFSRLDDQPRGTVAKLTIKPSIIYRKATGGSLVERCHLYLELRRGIEPTQLTLSLENDGRTEQMTVPVRATAFGHLHQAFELFDGHGPVKYCVRGEVNGEVFEQAGQFVRRRKWKVYLTPHAHTDIGYTHRQWEVAERLCRNIDTALDLLAESAAEEQQPGCPRSFAYHLDSSWALETYLATRGERRRHQLMEQIRAGRISLPSIYVDMLTQYAALEDLIRNGEFTESVLRPEGMRADFSTVVDVASLSGSLPAVLEGSGVRYLVHANNQDRGPFRLNGGLHRISPFFWEGVNGGKVLVWLAKMYCELRKVCGSPPVLSSAERGLEMWLDEYETGEYAPDAVLLYGQEADNTDLDPQPMRFVTRWNEMYAYPRLIACNVSEFFRYVEEHFGEALRTVKGDGGAYWEDGVGSSIVPSMEVRRAQAMLPAAERLEALAVVHNEDWTYPGRHFDEGWRQLLLFDEHTWGAFLSCGEPEALLQQDQWSIKEHMARNSVQWAGRLLHGAATRHSLSWNNDGREIVVYNAHSWNVSGPVTAEIFPRERVFDAASGAEVPTRRLRTLSSQAIVELWIDELPGLSYRRLLLREVEPGGFAPSPEASATAEQGDVVLENRHYRVVVDRERGCITSWIDKALNRELVDTTDEWGFGQFLYTEGGEGTRLVSNQSDWPDGDPKVVGEFRLVQSEVKRFDFGTSLIARGRVPFGELEIEWTLRDRAKRLDVRYTYFKEERLAKEAVYIAFPLDLPGAQVLSDSQLGWVNWDQDELPGGCKEWLPLQSGILACHSEADVFIASPDIPLFCVGNVVQGHWPKQLDLSGGRLFSYVLNNYWHTNYKASQGGEITWHYQLSSDRQIERHRAFRMGWEARRALYAQRMSFQDFRQPRAPYEDPSGGTLARIGSDRVVLSTMKQARWAAGFIVRLQEISGADQTATVSFPGKKITRAWATDLLEREEREIAVEPDGALCVAVPAWGLATVRILVEAPDGAC